MSTCDKRYKTAGPGNYSVGQGMSRSAVGQGMQRGIYSNYQTARYPSSYGNPAANGGMMPRGMNSSVMVPLNQSAYKSASGGDNGQLEVAYDYASCAPVALAPAPLPACDGATCTKQVACFCGGQFLLSDKGRMSS